MTDKKKAATNLIEFLTQKIQDNKINDESPVPIKELFEVFNNSGLSYAGQMCLGYHNTGIEIGLMVGIDFAKLFVPFGPLTASIVANFSAAKVNRNLLLIQRQPNLSIDFSGVKKDFDASVKEQKSLNISTYFHSNPICFINFRGVSFKATASLGVNVGVGFKFSAPQLNGKDECAAEFICFASLNASISGNIEVIYLSDGGDFTYYNKGTNLPMYLGDEMVSDRYFTPKWYRSERDSELIKFFALWAGLGDKKTLKKRIASYINSQYTLNSVNEHTGRWSMIDHLKIIQTKSSFKPKDKSIVDEYIVSLGQNLFLDPEVIPADKEFQRKRELVLKRLTALQPNPSCSLTAFTHTFDSKAQANASIGAAGTSLTANAIAKGKWAKTQYRYQTILGRTMEHTMTQDTCLHYSQIQLHASVKAGLGSKGLDKKASGVYNSFIYKSVVCFHKKPIANMPINMIERSGINFGISVEYSRLCKQKDTIEESFVNLLSNALCVPKFVLLDFFKNSWLLEKVNAQPVPNGIIILESAWSINPNTTLNADVEGKITDLLTHFETALNPETISTQQSIDYNGFSLQSICGRYRIADFENNSKSLFKLGVPKGIGGPVIAEFSLNKIDEIGVNGMVDLDTYWVDEDLKLISNNYPALAYELAVPRVAIFHQ